MKRFEARPFALIGVNVARHEPGRLKEIMAREGLSWRTFDDQGDIVRRWNLSGLPTFYVIDARGVIRRRWVGAPGAKALDEALESAVREAERAAK